MEIPTIDSILDAAARIAPHAHTTPVLESASLNRLAGARLFFKAEHLQRVGAFKFRGACNAVFSLDAATAARGVVTQSSGNHGAAIALACRMRGVPATVVVPRNAPAVKLSAMKDYGATLVLCDPSQADRDAATREVLAETGGELIHPFDDPRVIAGQGTTALELLRQVPDLDAVVAPVSGGGLLSGVAITAKAVKPGIRVHGAEPDGAADAHESLRLHRRITDMRPETICDGLRAQLSERTFAILSRDCDGILLASDDDTRSAMRWIYQRLKQVVEPSAALALAVVLREPERFAGQRVGIILTGGNLDMDAMIA